MIYFLPAAQRREPLPIILHQERPLPFRLRVLQYDADLRLWIHALGLTGQGHVVRARLGGEYAHGLDGGCGKGTHLNQSETDDV